MYKNNELLSVDVVVAIAPINNTLHSLFNQIGVSLNDVNVSSVTTTYPYRPYIETHLNYRIDAKNQGAKLRHGICTSKPTFDMIGPLHIDVFNQSKYILNRVTMKVENDLH